MDKDYNQIRLQNGVKNAIEEALADITLIGIKCKAEQYEAGILTAKELNDYIYSVVIAVQVGKNK